jgi:sulfate transporter 4
MWSQQQQHPAPQQPQHETEVNENENVDDEALVIPTDVNGDIRTNLESAISTSTSTSTSMSIDSDTGNHTDPLLPSHCSSSSSSDLRDRIPRHRSPPPPPQQHQPPSTISNSSKLATFSTNNNNNYNDDENHHNHFKESITTSLMERLNHQQHNHNHNHIDNGHEEEEESSNEDSDEDTEDAPPNNQCSRWLRRQRRRRIRTHRSNKCGMIPLLTRSEWCVDVMHRWLQQQYYIFQTHGLSDMISGMIVGIMIVPQSMSYAKLAGLPVEYGLYSSLIPIYTYAIYGIFIFSAQNIHSLLAIGPVALISLMLSSGLSNIMQSKDISPSNNEQYTVLYEQLAIQCSMLVGMISLLMGICQYRSYNIGTIITQCLSHTVISGFTSGAATIIALSQCKYILGYTKVPSADTVPSILQILVTNRNQFHVATFLMGGLSLLILLLARHLSQHPFVKKNVGYQRLLALTPLLVTITAVVCTILLPLQQRYHVLIVGTIPRGLPHPTLPSSLAIITWQDMVQLFPVALSITIIGFMETIAIAKQLASKQQQQRQQQQQHHHHLLPQSVDTDNDNNTPVVTMEVDTSQELIALGLSNIMGSMFHAYPVAGSFSRSAMNYSSGGQTRYSGIVTACIVAMALLILTPFFEQLPYNTLAAIVISGVIGLFDYNEAKHLWNVDRIDCIVWCISCGCTMCFGCEYGLAVAIPTSFMASFYKMTYLPIALLGRVTGTDHYRNIQLCPEAQPIDGTIIMRICGPIYFANMPHIERTIQTLICDVTATSRVECSNGTGTCRTGPATQCSVILDMSCVVYIDGTALRRLKHMIATTSNIAQFCFTDVSNHTVQQFLFSDILESTNGRDPIFPSIHDAVQRCSMPQQSL